VIVVQLMFWLCVIAIGYPYIIYPALIALAGAVVPGRVNRRAAEPSVTVLIAAYNEAKDIEQTVVNKLQQDYPKNKLQIIVISDGSEDGTDDIVKKYQKDGVQLIRQEPRQGKAAALNLGVKQATGDVLIFSDANSIFDKQAIRHFVANFEDPQVGYVTGKLHYTDDNGTLSGDGCSAYMKYENWLRKLETKFNSIIGVNGGVDAIRRQLYRDIPKDLITDFVLPLSVLQDGYRVVYDDQVKSYETPNASMQSEFRMRTRVALRALQGVLYMRKLLNPFNYLKGSFSLWSHKVIRYLAPVFMIGALVLNVLLAITSPLYAVLLVLHGLAYVAAMAGLFVPLPQKMQKLVYVPSYLLMTNAAFALALVKLFRGEKMAVWKPRVG